MDDASHKPTLTPHSSSGDPLVVAGHVTALRLFDLAYSIDLVAAQRLWAGQAGQGARSRLTGTPPKAVSFGEPPLGLVLPPVQIALGCRHSRSLRDSAPLCLRRGVVCRPGAGRRADLARLRGPGERRAVRNRPRGDGQTRRRRSGSTCSTRCAALSVHR